MAKNRGFTLIELMVVVAIIAILASIAIPAYFNYVRKSRRSEVEVAMQQIAMMEERFRADCPAYTSVAFAAQSSPVNCASDSVGPNPYTNSAAYYVVTFPVAATATSYKIQAAAQSAGGQNKDKAAGTSCATLTYDFGVTTAGVVTKAPADCW